ncbi:MAG: tagatose 1,6-diphosphate aldolase [Anaerolineaceae bacterium]|nr:tagatose 1,6-diphosphate aldolase [Anaerolineaceae bacterium]
MNIGKLRGLQEISTPEGFITVLALDQRGSLFKALGISESDPALYQAVREFKKATTSELMPACSAVLLDPEFAAAEAISEGWISGQKGLIVTLEETGYVDSPDGRLNPFIPNWSLGKAKRMGASAAKLLAYYDPRNKKLADHQERFISDIIEGSVDLDFPLLLEPMSYSADPSTPKKSPEFAKIRPQIVCDTAERLGALGVDLLKMEFPCDTEFETDKSVWLKACEEITKVSPVPWVLLSAGVDFDVFKEQLGVACKAGASGFVAGRAIWKEAVPLKGQERIDFLSKTGKDRMNHLVEIVNHSARSWKDAVRSEKTHIEQGWINNYQDF